MYLSLRINSSNNKRRSCQRFKWKYYMGKHNRWARISCLWRYLSNKIFKTRWNNIK